MFNPSRKIFRLAASLMLVFMLAQPFAAFAEEQTTTITEETAAESQTYQSVEAGATGGVEVTTEVIYSTSTPAVLPTSPEPEATTSSTSLGTSTPESAASTTPESTASTTPESTASTTPETLGGGGGGSSSTTPDSTASTSPESLSGSLGLNLENGQSTTTSSSTLEIINMNDIDIKTISTSTAVTGLNDIESGGDILDSDTVAGEVNVFANVLTVANVNLVNSEIVEMNNTFNQLAADLYFDQTELSAGQRTKI